MLGEPVETNPRLLIGDAEHDMVQLWGLFRGGRTVMQTAGMGGGAAMASFTPGHLPESGGAGEQSALMLEAFSVMSAAAQQLEREHG